MPFRPTAFSRLLEPLDRRLVGRAVAAHDGNFGVGGGPQAWTCERHLKVLLFAQLAGLKSLREIVETLGPQSAAFYHLNLRAPCRATLSDANRARPWLAFRDIAAALLPRAARTLRREGDAMIRLLDASPIPLKDQRFVWAEQSARTRGLKLHLVHDPRQVCPVWFDVTSAKLDDMVGGRAVPLEAGATYVFDKGYTDYRWWAAIIEAGALFVTRGKKNACRRGTHEMPVVGEGILVDRRLKLGHRRPHAGAPKNPLYDTQLREVVVARPDKDTPLSLFTNDLARPAVEIARLYKERWDIELMFKWLKQNLNIRRFLGRSENAVRIQIYVAMIAFLLLRILHHTVFPAARTTAALLLAQLKIALFQPLACRRPAKPPPARRPPNPQLRFLFRCPQVLS